MPAIHQRGALLGRSVGRITFRGFDFSYAVQSPCAEAVELLAARAPSGFARSEDSRVTVTFSVDKVEGVWSLHESGREVARWDDLLELSEQLGDLVVWFAATRSTARTFLHAACVATEGSIIVLPGDSGSGKSTLTKALVANGADYLSDEYALIDAEGNVAGYPRPIAVEGSDGRRVRYPVRPTPLDAPPALVVFSRFVEGVDGPTGLEELGPAISIARLLRHTVSLQAAPAAALERLTKVVRAAPVVAVDRGEAESFAAWLIGEFPRLRSRSPAEVN